VDLVPKIHLIIVADDALVGQVVSGGSGKLDKKVFFLSEALPG
jgi:hypothetical protein